MLLGLLPALIEVVKALRRLKTNAEDNVVVVVSIGFGNGGGRSSSGGGNGSGLSFLNGRRLQPRTTTEAADLAAVADRSRLLLAPASVANGPWPL